MLVARCLSRSFQPGSRLSILADRFAASCRANLTERALCRSLRAVPPSRSGDLPDGDGSGPGTRTPATLKGLNATIVLISSRFVWLTNTIDQIVKELPGRSRPFVPGLAWIWRRINHGRCHTNHHSTLSAGARMLLSNPPRPAGDTRYVREAKDILTPRSRRSTPRSRFSVNGR
jgi:hypothetical protein